MQQYETLRFQALEATHELHDSTLEQLGMAAWMQSVPEIEPVQRGNGTPPSPDLVWVLADLVIGNRREVQDG